MAPQTQGQARTGVLKVVQVENRRRSFRLEPVFWEVLAETAEETGLRLGRFVNECLAQVPQRNHTSALRVAAMLKLLRDRAAIRMAGEPEFHQQLFHTAPTPAVLLSESARILDCNEALAAWLGEAAAHRMVGQTLPEAYHVRTRVPWPRLWEMLRTGERTALRVPIVHSAPGRVTAGEAMILRSPKGGPHQADAFAWLISRRTQPPPTAAKA